MNNQWQSAEERLTELLADQAAFGLDAHQQQVLEELLDLLPDFDLDSMERTAAVVQLALGPAEHEPLPAALHAKLRAGAARYLAPQVPRDRNEAGGT